MHKTYLEILKERKWKLDNKIKKLHWDIMRDSKSLNRFKDK